MEGRYRLFSRFCASNAWKDTGVASDHLAELGYQIRLCLSVHEAVRVFDEMRDKTITQDELVKFFQLDHAMEHYPQQEGAADGPWNNEGTVQYCWECSEKFEYHGGRALCLKCRKGPKVPKTRKDNQVIKL